VIGYKTISSLKIQLIKNPNESKTIEKQKDLMSSKLENKKFPLPRPL